VNETECPDCGSTELEGPDFEGFYDCRECGAAWKTTTNQPEGSNS
jgi:ribosomal protein L37AE/L43A